MPPKDKKEKPKDTNLEPIELVLILLLITVILGSVTPFINKILSGSFEITFFGLRISSLVDLFKNNIGLFKFLGFSIGAVGAVATVMLNRMADKVWENELKELYPEGYKKSTITGGVAHKDPIELKWEQILKLSESSNHSDWRLAIIEADIILDDLLEKMRLPGETMGEKLKAIEKSDFVTLDEAWEAHKARNMIAHEGSNFLLNQRETRRIISLYEAVFKEFHLI